MVSEATNLFYRCMGSVATTSFVGTVVLAPGYVSPTEDGISHRTTTTLGRTYKV